MMAKKGYRKGGQKLRLKTLLGDTITLASINLNKSHTAGGNFAKLMEDIDIACLQEPPINKNGTIGGQKGLKYIAYGDKPRAGISWKGKYSIVPLPHISDGDIANGLWTKPDNKHMVVCSTYLDQTRDIKLDIEKIEKYAATKGYELVIMGGYECSQHTVGQQRDNEQRGEFNRLFFLFFTLEHTIFLGFSRYTISSLSLFHSQLRPLGDDLGPLVVIAPQIAPGLTFP